MLSFEIAAVHNLCLDLPHLSQQNCFGEHKVVLQIESILCFFMKKITLIIFIKWRTCKPTNIFIQMWIYTN